MPFSNYLRLDFLSFINDMKLKGLLWRNREKLIKVVIPPKGLFNTSNVPGWKIFISLLLIFGLLISFGFFVAVASYNNFIIFFGILLTNTFLWLNYYPMGKIFMIIGSLTFIGDVFIGLFFISFGFFLQILEGSHKVIKADRERKLKAIKAKKERKRVERERKLKERSDTEGVLNTIGKIISKTKSRRVKKTFKEGKLAFDKKDYRKAKELAYLANELAKEYYEKQQRAKGLVKYRGRWAKPEQVKKWKEIEIGLSNNFANLSPYQFENFIAKLFQKMGYTTGVTSKTGDFGADILAKLGDKKVLIEVKKYSKGNLVTPKEVQRTLGALWKHKADKAVFITTSDFTVRAKGLEKEAPIELWDKEILHKMVRKHFIEEE